MVGSPCCPRDSHESSSTPQFKSINFFTDEITQRKDVKYKGKKALEQNIEEYHYLKKVICLVSHKRGKNVGVIQIRNRVF